MLITDEVYQGLVKGSDQFGMFGSGNTYGGHPVAAAVAVETLNIYADLDIVNHVKMLETQFLKRLSQLEAHPLVGQARGVGLIGAVEIVRDKQTREQFPVADKVAVQIANFARSHQLILRPTPGDSVALCPPLIINSKELDMVFDRLTAALDDMVQTLA